jgi:hypothetical protein
MAQQELRRRRKKKDTDRSKGTVSKAATTNNNSTEAPATSGDETLWKTFTRHPLVVVAPWVLLPYLVYTLYLFLTLRRPDLVETFTMGAVQLRPAVTDKDERQLLIVGVMGSGTTQVATTLSKTLKLEIGHEMCDTHGAFVRDGTVSWFHGIRYIPPPADDDMPKFKLLTDFCLNFTANMGFHPQMYHPSDNKCSSMEKWNNCWAKECISVVFREWGCGLTPGLCRTPFFRVLHQTRHPVQTIESLVAKFCSGGLNGTVHNSFIRYATFFFPRHNFSSYSCVEAAAYFAIDYNQALLDARAAGVIDAMYQVESTSPCEIARLAGMADPSTLVYPPNFGKVASSCSPSTVAYHDAKQNMTSVVHRVNKDYVRLNWTDFAGGVHGSQRSNGDKSLEKLVRKMVKKLGYSSDNMGVHGGFDY